jgi:signal transduction histidine kinase
VESAPSIQWLAGSAEPAQAGAPQASAEDWQAQLPAGLTTVPFPNYPREADACIQRLMGRILERCGPEICRLGDQVLMGNEIQDEYQQQARGIIDDFLESLALGTMVIDRQSVAAAGRLGQKLPAEAISPSEFSRLAAGISDAVSAAVIEDIRSDPGGLADSGEVARRVCIALRALGRSAAERYQRAAECYETLLLERASEVQGEDRRRLARCIHDNVGNDLSLAIRYLDLHDAYRETDPGLASAKLSAARTTLHDVLEAIRKLATDLRLEPPVADMGQALAAFLRTFDTSHMVTGVQVDGDEARIPATIRKELFIIAREALRNAMAHARARQVTATIRIAADSIYTEIRDDGVGIGPVSDPATARGNGVALMRERAELLGGKLAVSSHRSHGTRVVIQIPLPGHSNATVR